MMGTWFQVWLDLGATVSVGPVCLHLTFFTSRQVLSGTMVAPGPSCIQQIHSAAWGKEQCGSDSSPAVAESESGTPRPLWDPVLPSNPFFPRYICLLEFCQEPPCEGIPVRCRQSTLQRASPSRTRVLHQWASGV